MYIYVTAMLKERGANSQYQTVDVRQMRLDQILARYLDGWIELENTLIQDHFFVSIPMLRRFAVPYGGNTFNTWLGQVNNIALPSFDATPSIESKDVIYSDGFLAQFHAKRVRPFSAAAGDDHPEPLLRAIQVTKVGFLLTWMSRNMYTG